MPSQFHETLLLLFRNRPQLAPELIRDALHLTLPDYTDVRIDSAEFSDVQPAQYRADLVLVLATDSPVLGIVLEVQLTPHEDKPYAWPAYVVNLRARIRAPVCLLVVAAEESVARWARTPIYLGGENHFVPWVLGPTDVPEITDNERAQRDPELAVLSAIAHAESTNVQKSVSIAVCAQLASFGLDADRSKLYRDLVFHFLSEDARRALKDMSQFDPSKEMNQFNHPYPSDFVRLLVAEGRVEIVLHQLTTRFGVVPNAIIDRLRRTSRADLEAIANRLLSAQTLAAALDPS